MDGGSRVVTQSAAFEAMLKVVAAAGGAAAPVPRLEVEPGGSPVDDALAVIAAGMNEQSAAMSAELASIAKRLEDRFFNGGAEAVPGDGEHS
jgi:hypothetical protein